MITPFDGLILIGFGVAMLLSSEPKKSAIFAVVILTAIITLMDYAFDGWTIMCLAALMEFMLAGTLLAYRRTLPNARDRVFFYMMALFLWLSASAVAICVALTMLLDLGWSQYVYIHGDYVKVSHAIALTHLLMMLSFSDRIGSVFRNMRDAFYVHRRRAIDSRG